MGVITLLPSGDPGLDFVLQQIDERLSELYSQHGTQTPRDDVKSGTVTLRTDLKSGTLVTGQIYRDMAIIGMVATRADGVVLFSKNIIPATGAGTNAETSTGVYEYRVLSGTNGTNFCVVAGQNGITAGTLNVSASIPKQSAIRVDTTDSTATYVQVAHTVIVFGEVTALT